MGGIVFSTSRFGAVASLPILVSTALHHFDLLTSLISFAHFAFRTASAFLVCSTGAAEFPVGGDGRRSIGVGRGASPDLVNVRGTRCSLGLRTSLGSLFCRPPWRVTLRIMKEARGSGTFSPGWPSPSLREMVGSGAERAMGRGGGGRDGGPAVLGVSALLSSCRAARCWLKARSRRRDSVVVVVVVVVVMGSGGGA